MQKFDHNIVFLESTNIFSENGYKSQKTVIITSAPGTYALFN
jgi:hypothetical protein